MKKVFKFTALMLCVSMIFAACKKEEPTPTPEDKDYGKAIAGDYVGSLSMNGGVLVEEATLSLVRISNDSVIITTAIDLSGLGMGTLPVSTGAAVTKNTDKKFLVTGTTTVTIPMMGQQIPAQVGISGTIDEQGKADFNLQVSLTTPMGPQMMSVEFKGQKQ